MPKHWIAVLFATVLLVPIAAQQRAPQSDSIRQDDLRMLAKDDLEPLFRVQGREDAKAFALERRREQFETPRIIVDDDE